MWLVFVIIGFMAFAGLMAGLSYLLGRTKTDNPRMAAMIGLLLSFIPPFALVYLVILALKEEVGTV